MGDSSAIRGGSVRDRCVDASATRARPVVEPWSIDGRPTGDPRGTHWRFMGAPRVSGFGRSLGTRELDLLV